MSLVGRRFLIKGRVQGVGFRHFTRRAAQLLGVVGWVRNLPDGSVEALGWAPGDVLNEFRAVLQEGPRFSRVTGVVESEDVGPHPEEGGFEVRTTR